MKRFLRMLIDKESSPFEMPYLPDDLLLNCLARVSRLYYPTLSLVSKRFCSLIASLELYATRTLLGRTESCLYVCLGFGSGVFEYESNPRWFTLCRRPTQIFNPNPNPNSQWFTCCFRPYKIETNPTRKEEKKSSDNLLVSVPTPTRNFSHLFWWDCTAVGSTIYMIVVDQYNYNGSLSSSSRVCFMDCRSHTWHEAPSMRTARKYPIVSALDGKIYVVEGYKDLNSSNLIEFFDPKTQIWQHVPSPSAELRLTIHSLAMDGKLYLFGINKSMVYKPKENTWDVLGLHLHLDLYFDRDTCVIDNTIYCCESSGKLQWYDFEGRSWRNLKGLEDLPTLPKHLTYVKLVNYGGKMAVLWQKKVLADESAGIDHSMNQMIWCAEISLERRNNGQEIYGKIEWCDVVLTAPKSHLLKFVVAVNV